MTEIGSLTTEASNPRTSALDSMPIEELLRTMNAEDVGVASAVAQAIPEIARAVELIVAARRRGGRLIYVGAGTSGRLGMLDAVECPPTFGTDPGEVLGIIAGGPDAFLRAVEGAEDDPALAVADLSTIALTGDDVVVALAASGRTPTPSVRCGMAARSVPRRSRFRATAMPKPAHTPTSASKSKRALRF